MTTLKIKNCSQKLAKLNTNKTKNKTTKDYSCKTLVDYVKC